LATADYQRESEQGGIMRCWKRGAGFDCLTVYEGKWREALRQLFPALPRNLGSQLDRATAGPGYRCALSTDDSGYQEEIRGENGKLTSHVHTILSTEPGWTGDYAESFMRDNGVHPKTLYFDCAHLQEELAKGSLATVGTTAIDFAALTGETAL